MSSSLLFPRNISLSAAPICAAALTDPSRPANTRHQDEDFCNTTAARRATGSPWSATSPIRVQRRTSPSLARPYACIVPPSSRPRPFSQPRPSLLSRLLKMQVRRSRLHRRGFRQYSHRRLALTARQHSQVRCIVVMLHGRSQHLRWKYPNNEPAPPRHPYRKAWPGKRQEAPT